MGFLFTFTNPHNIPPTMYPSYPLPLHRAPELINCYSGFGPCFGILQSWDIAISHNSNLHKNNSIGFPSCYIDATEKGKFTLTGEEYFTTSEIEVYSVIKRTSED